MLKFILFSFALIAVCSVRTDAARQCLMPHFVTNYTSDGLTNCTTCEKGFEYDEMFGICFKNKCKQHCNDMECLIRKPTKDRFEYLCICPSGFQPLSPHYKFKCVPFEADLANRMVAINLPKNPILMKKLNCSQSYELVNDEYKCKCFDGYELNKNTGECELKQKCMRRCPLNAVCTVDEQKNTHCTCKTGFTGPDCEQNFCEMKNVTEDEKTYLHLAINNVCGTRECSLNKQNNEFECECRFGMERGEDGFCHVRKPCRLGGLGYKACIKEKNQLCSIRADESDNYKCNCEQNVGYNMQRTCNDYKPKHLPPATMNGASNHTIKMKVRLDWQADDIFFSLFANQLWNSLNPGIEKRLPPFAIKEFIDYEQEVFKMNYPKSYSFYGPILEDKLKTIFMKGIKKFAHLDEKCGNYTVHPELDYDRSTLELTRLINTVFEITYLIQCAKPLNSLEFSDKFTQEFLVQDYVENYYYMNHTGYVLPESVQITSFNP